MPLGHKTGVLLVNLGTPDAPRAPEVRRYLREFLVDPRVIDINPVGRWLLVNLFVAPFRAPKSAEAYEQVWTKAGSPLLVHSRDLADAVAKRLPHYEVELGMRYGRPSLVDGMSRLRDAGCDHLVLVPLYPQYASSSTGSTLELVYREAQRLWNTPYISVTPPFFDHPGFLDAFASVGRPVLADLDPDHVVFSFHGLPERQIKKSDPTGRHCLASDDCCDRAIAADDGEPAAAGRDCYRAQCVSTARGIAERLGISRDGYTISFQSRLGRAEWIKPDTPSVVNTLQQRGVKRIAVFCPAFVADCLETLEEIGIRLKSEFEGAGGERLELVPSLNAEAVWVDAVVDLVERTAVPPHRRLPVVSSRPDEVESA